MRISVQIRDSGQVNIYIKYLSVFIKFLKIMQASGSPVLNPHVIDQVDSGIPCLINSTVGQQIKLSYIMPSPERGLFFSLGLVTSFHPSNYQDHRSGSFKCTPKIKIFL